MDEQEIRKVISAAVKLELDKMKRRRIKVSSPLEIVAQVFEGVGNPQPLEDDVTEVTVAPPEPRIPPPFPRLLADYDKKVPEFIVVNDFAQWAPYHAWYNIFPPQQPASRPVTTTLEGEVERLKSEGLRERPREEHERRRQTKGYAE